MMVAAKGCSEERAERTVDALPQSDGKEAKAIDLDQPLSNDERKIIVRRALNTEQADAEYMLSMIRERFDRCNPV